MSNPDTPTSPEDSEARHKAKMQRHKAAVSPSAFCVRAKTLAYMR